MREGTVRVRPGAPFGGSSEEATPRFERGCRWFESSSPIHARHQEGLADDCNPSRSGLDTLDVLHASPVRSARRLLSGDGRVRVPGAALHLVTRHRPRMERLIPNRAERVRVSPVTRHDSADRSSPVLRTPVSECDSRRSHHRSWRMADCLPDFHTGGAGSTPAGTTCLRACASSSSGYSSSCSDDCPHLIPVEYVALCELTLVDAHDLLEHEEDGCPRPSRKRVLG